MGGGGADGGGGGEGARRCEVAARGLGVREMGKDRARGKGRKL